MRTSLFSLGLLACAASVAVFASDPQLYKWTDSQGVIHYSDKPPAGSGTNVQTMSLPTLPPPDATKVAAAQAALVAQVAQAQRLVQAQAQAQQEEAALAAQQAALNAQASQIQQQEQFQESQQIEQGLTQPPPAIFYHSQFVPGSYRRNLYLPVQPAGVQPSGQTATSPPPRPLHNRAPISLLGKPQS